MPLIFPRLAQNFVKRGYYPTDSETLTRICSAISTLPAKVRIVDPCCGEGAAVAHIADHLLALEALPVVCGIEVDGERAWRAKDVLGRYGARIAHADMHDVIVSRGSASLLFLNPPYGDLIADKAAIGDGKRDDRHEKVFCRRWFPTLQTGGVLALVVPYYVLDEELATMLARHFEQIHIYLAPVQDFRQAVILGVKKVPSNPSADLVREIVAMGRGEGMQAFPEVWPHRQLVVPEMSGGNFTFNVASLDALQLADELEQAGDTSTMWPKFRFVFGRSLALAERRPLCRLSKWHLALALAAGSISGVVESSTGRTMLVKGGTHKKKAIEKVYEHKEDGSVVQSTIATDVFVPSIKAIDFTPGTSFGEVFTIG